MLAAGRSPNEIQQAQNKAMGCVSSFGLEGESAKGRLLVTVTQRTYTNVFRRTS